MYYRIFLNNPLINQNKKLISFIKNKTKIVKLMKLNKIN